MVTFRNTVYSSEIANLKIDFTNNSVEKSTEIENLFIYNGVCKNIRGTISIEPPGDLENLFPKRYSKSGKALPLAVVATYEGVGNNLGTRYKNIIKLTLKTNVSGTDLWEAAFDFNITRDSLSGLLIFEGFGVLDKDIQIENNASQNKPFSHKKGSIIFECQNDIKVALNGDSIPERAGGHMDVETIGFSQMPETAPFPTALWHLDNVSHTRPKLWLNSEVSNNLKTIIDSKGTNDPTAKERDALFSSIRQAVVNQLAEEIYAEIESAGWDVEHLDTLEQFLMTDIAVHAFQEPKREQAFELIKSMDEEDWKSFKAEKMKLAIQEYCTLSTVWGKLNIQ